VSDKEAIIGLFAAGHLPEAEAAARTMAERYPGDSFAWKSWGAVLTQQGQNQEAVSRLQTALKLSPREADTHNTLGTAWQNLGRLEEAVYHYRRALQLHPGYAEAHNNLGNALRKLGRLEEALASCDRALALVPGDAEAHCNRGLILREAHRLEEALLSLQRAAACRSDYADAYLRCGAVASELGRFEEAATSYRSLLTVQPANMEARRALAALCRQLGQLDEAVAICRSAVEIQPDAADMWCQLGLLQRQVGRLEDAANSFRRATEALPDYADALNNLGLTCFDLARLDEACTHCERALAIQPDFAEAHNNLANVLSRLHRWDEALGHYQRALEIQPNLAETHSNRGVLLQEMLRCDEAQASFERALELQPDMAIARYNLGYLLMECGSSDEAFSHWRRAIRMDPQPTYLSSLLYHDASLRVSSPADHIAEARKWECLALSEAEREAACTRRFDLSPRHGRPLRVGISSAELGYHAVSYFLMSWMREIDRQRVQLYLYPTSLRREPEVAILRALADQWTPLCGLTDADAADRIRSDRVDILLDTTGHMRDCRLGVFAHRAAPVQCHYIGYFATTGLSAMDYFLADDILVPPALDAQFTETVWRLPRTWVAYAPLADTPPPAWCPAPDGVLRLGSFNNFSKLSDNCLALWARVLKALPTAELLLKDRKTAIPSAQARVMRTLAHHGIPKERVRFLPRVSDWRQHMSLYDQLDVALDTIPFGSGTTGFDALWMGVPLITLVGDWLGARMGASMVAALGHPEWIAQSEDEYVEKAVGLARDTQLRTWLRSQQQERMRQSPLCDARTLARSLEAAFETMFDRWWQRKKSL
jgi:predicted O-linked N-acetylglucosamine transferase (SPINDLY family)